MAVARQPVDSNPCNSILDEGYSDRLRFSFGSRQPCPFPTVTAAFYHHAQLHPGHVAARDLSGLSAREVSYAELAKRSQHLALHLRGLGVKPGDRVPLVVRRGIEMLVGIFAILSCGAQYVPLDGGVVPDSTLRLVLKQSQSKLAVCLPSTEYRVLAVTESSCQTIVIESSDKDGEQPDEVGWEDLASSDSGCYVIYTSGTTGPSKGVDVTHRNVTNLVCLSPGNLGIMPGIRVGQVLNISFDMAAWEILGCLCNGGTLVLRGSDWEQALHHIDVLICTPSILCKYNPESFPNIKVVATAGEPSGQRLADIWAYHGVYYNCCGPTETTIVNTMQKHIPGQRLSIGEPTPNNSVYVLDENMNPVALGESGIMWAGGLGISSGYIGLPELTAERYKVDKFANDGSMMYNTGDLGRWRADGRLDILGRVDDQVKVKGFRVELDGISASMSTGPGVSRAIALLIDGQIHGFVTPRGCDTSSLLNHLKTCQPYYAVPSRLHLLDSFPETNNGKIDKRVLRSLVEPRREVFIEDKAGVSSPSISTFSDTALTEVTDFKTELSSSKTTELGEGEKLDLSPDLPDKTLKQPLRGLVHRAFIVYRFLFSIVGMANVAALVAVFIKGLDRQWLGTLTAINLVLAVIIRQDFVINALYTISCSVPKRWPLSIRKRCAKIYHLGGMHSGAAFCAGAWLLVSNVTGAVCGVTTCSISASTNAAEVSLASAVVSWLLTILFLVMFGFAWPPFRKRNHDLFERVHRFVGWTMLALFWVQTVLSIDDARPLGQQLGQACLRAPTFWLLVVASCSIASSWLFLRRVPVEAEVLSDHAVRLHFGYTVPVNGTFTRLSRRPLLEWHSFATIPAPESTPSHVRGYSLVVSNAGDWTRSCIRDAPSRLWIRGVPTCGVMRIATLFNRVVVVATGSGIGPLLGHIQAPSCPTQLIWSTPNPEKTFGRDILAAIRAKIPDAVIHDTKILGRPDLVRMGYNLAKSFDAEAVIVIANEKITKKIVYGLETRGVPAFGAIWDS